MDLDLPRFHNREIINTFLLWRWWGVYILLHTENQPDRTDTIGIRFLPNEEMMQLFRDQYQERGINSQTWVKLGIQLDILDTFLDCRHPVTPEQLDNPEQVATLLLNELDELLDLFKRIFSARSL